MNQSLTKTIIAPYLAMPIHNFSLAVLNPKLEWLLDLETGEARRAHEIIGADYQKALQLRLLLKERNSVNRPILICPLCGVAVHMVCKTEARQFYFRHEIEDGRCPVKTSDSLSEERINAMKYHGARESATHIRMKQIIAESLACDPEFSKIEIEPIWKGLEKNERRRPDVRAVWRNTLPVAFEVQLSTTFLRVIAERRQFYLRNGGLLLWVFHKFDMGDARLTQEDIFYNNNRNAFLASEETLSASRTTRSAVFNCIWSEPMIETGQLTWSPRQSLAAFQSLIIEQATQRIFLFDADAALRACVADGKHSSLRKDFSAYWLSRTGYDYATWQDFRQRFFDVGLELPPSPEENGFQALLNTLYTAKEGQPVGWRHADIVKVAHHVFDKYKTHLWAFRLVLAAYARGDLIRQLDSNKTWQNRKVPAYRSAWRDNDPNFMPDRQFDSLIVFLFPEIAEELALDPR